jgi:hypothetical protein
MAKAEDIALAEGDVKMTKRAIKKLLKQQEIERKKAAKVTAAENS